MSLPGEELWRFQVGASEGYDYAYGVSASADGSFFLAGSTDGAVDAATENAGGDDLAVAKISGVDGSALWYWQEGAVGDDGLSCAAATEDGGVVVGGYSNGTYNGILSEGLVDFVAIKLDGDGDVEWRWQEGTVEDDYINSCSTTADGNVVLTGSTSEDWEVASSGASSVVAVKLDVTDGTVLWRYQAGVAPNMVFSRGSAARSDGSVVLVGGTTGAWDGQKIGISDFAAVALDEDGLELWRYQGGHEDGINYAYAVAALADDSVVLTGVTSGDFAGAGTHMGGTDFVAIKLTAAGAEEWTWQDGTELDDEFAGVAAGIDGTSVIFAGNTYGSWVETHAGDGYRDFAGMAMDADKNVLWEYQTGTAGPNDFNGVAVRPTDGAALLMGWTYDDWVVDGTSNYYTDAAGVLLEAGDSTITSPAPTPAPEIAPQPVTPTPEPVGPISSSTPQPAVPSSCGASESFRITSAALPEVEGCFQATEAMHSTGSALEAWSVSGNLDYDQVIVSGNQDDGEYTDTPYHLWYWTEDEDDIILYCSSNEDSITVHPTDATWTCDLSGTGTYTAVTDSDISFDCGCDGPSPVVAEPTSSPVVTEDRSDTSSSSSSVPLGAVIGGSVGGALLLAIVGVVAVKRHRKNRGGSSGSSPPGPVNYPVIPDGFGGLEGRRSGPVPPPRRTAAYTEPRPTEAKPAPAFGDRPPPPAYAEPPAYDA